jgi:hypothetical protein
MDWNQYVITFDMDWAPDFIIEETIDVLLQHRIKGTYFITHDSPALAKLRTHPDLFEIGIHPNFLPGSSHGTGEREVLLHMAAMVPGVKSMRAHCLVQSSPLLAVARKEFGIENESAMLLPGVENIRPHRILFDHGAEPLIRLPMFFDIEAYLPDKSWSIVHPKYHISGLKIFNFHPMYIYLKMAPYRELKNVAPFRDLTLEQTAPFVNRNIPGSGTLFKELCGFIAKQKLRTHTIAELGHAFRQN